MGTRAVARFLDAAWYLLLAGAIVAVLLVIAGLLRPGHVRISIPAFLSLDPSTHPITSAYPGRHAELHGVTGELSIPGSRTLLVVTFAVIAVGLGLAGLVVFQLRRLLAGMMGGRAFAADSARRVRIIAVAVLAAELLRAVVLSAASWWAHNHLHGTGLAFREVFPVRIDVLLLALMLVLLGEVFRLGARLQDDHDLTI